MMPEGRDKGIEDGLSRAGEFAEPGKQRRKGGGHAGRWTNESKRKQKSVRWKYRQIGCVKTHHTLKCQHGCFPGGGYVRYLSLFKK